VSNSFGSLYPKDDRYSIQVDQALLDEAKRQQQDNQGALYARVQAIGLQVNGNPGLRNDIIAVLFDCAFVPSATINDAFALNGLEALEIRNAEPVSIYTCLRCPNPLPDGTRAFSIRAQRTLNYLCKNEEGNLVEVEQVSQLFCDTCAQGLVHGCREQARAEYLALKARQEELRKMPLVEYLQTPEWRVLRNRALIRAGHSCTLCPSRKHLNVHHRTYERRGHELLEDLIVLCRSCHQRHHDILPDAA
jgi:hypothetical protein